MSAAANSSSAGNEAESREQDRFLPIANISRIMKVSVHFPPPTPSQRH